MPNLSDNVIITIVIVVVIAVALFMMGRRLRRFNVEAGPVRANAEAGTPGANLTGNVVQGNLNKGTVKGDNAAIRNNKIVGSGNEFSADSSDRARDDV